MERMTISRRSLLCSAAAMGAVAALPAVASAARESPVDFAERMLGPLDEAHREWHRIWSDYRQSVILVPIGCGMTSQLRERATWEANNNPDLHIVTLTAHKTEVRTGSLWPAKQTIDLLIVDSIDCYTSVSSDYMHAATQERVRRFRDRLAPDGRMWAGGHRWADDDTLQKLAADPGVLYSRYDATRDEARTIATFPNVLPIERVKSLRRDLGCHFSELMLWHRLKVGHPGAWDPNLRSPYDAKWVDDCLANARARSA